MKSLEYQITELESQCQALVEELADVTAERTEVVLRFNELKAQSKECVITALDEAARLAEMEGSRLLSAEDEFNDALRIAMKIRQLKRKL